MQSSSFIDRVVRPDALVYPLLSDLSDASSNLINMAHCFFLLRIENCPSETRALVRTHLIPAYHVALMLFMGLFYGLLFINGLMLIESLIRFAFAYVKPAPSVKKNE